MVCKVIQVIETELSKFRSTYIQANCCTTERENTRTAIEDQLLVKKDHKVKLRNIES